MCQVLCSQKDKYLLQPRWLQRKFCFASEEQSGTNINLRVNQTKNQFKVQSDWAYFLRCKMRIITPALSILWGFCWRLNDKMKYMRILWQLCKISVLIWFPEILEFFLRFHDYDIISICYPLCNLIIKFSVKHWKRPKSIEIAIKASHPIMLRKEWSF